MTSLLLVDSSTDYCAVALSHNQQSYTAIEQQPRKHAQLLLPLIQKLLQQAHCSITDLDGIAYGRGPGSFAGIRIAASVVQGIGMAQQLPILGVSSLHMLAMSALKQNSQLLTTNSPIFVMINAHMGEVFWAGFKFCQAKWQCVTGENISSLGDGIQSWSKYLAQHPDAILVGDAIHLVEAVELETLAPVHKSDTQMDPTTLLADCHVAFEEGKFGAFSDHQPCYLRDSVSWKKLVDQPKLLQPKSQ